MSNNPTFMGGAIGLEDTEDAAGRAPTPFRFDHRSAAAIEAAERATAHLVTRVSDEMKAALRAVMAKGIEEGIPPRTLVRYISSSIGLNAPQAMALMNYRLRMEKTGASAESVEKAAAKYGARLLAQRKLMISRTETMRALNLGKLEGADQAVKAGLLGPGSAKRWTAAPEELQPPRCDVCANLDGEVVPLHARFSNGRVGPPAHPWCRCSIDILPEDEAQEPTPGEPVEGSARGFWGELFYRIGKLFGGKDFVD